MPFTDECAIVGFAAFEKKVLIEEFWVTESENTDFSCCETEQDHWIKRIDITFKIFLWCYGVKRNFAVALN